MLVKFSSHTSHSIEGGGGGQGYEWSIQINFNLQANTKKTP